METAIEIVTGCVLGFVALVVIALALFIWAGARLDKRRDAEMRERLNRCCRNAAPMAMLALGLAGAALFAGLPQ